MTTFTAFTTLPAKSAAEALGEAIEALDPAPYGVGVFEIEDGSGRWEVGGYFLEAPRRDRIGAFGGIAWRAGLCRLRIARNRLGRAGAP